MVVDGEVGGMCSGMDLVENNDVVYEKMDKE